MKLTRRILSLFVAALTVFSLLPSVTFAEIDNSLTVNGSHKLDAGRPVLGTEGVIENVQAALLYETTTETLMYAFNPDVQLHPTSFVKIMTAYVAVCEAKLEDEVIVNEKALEGISKGAATAKLVAGEIMTVEWLLYCMLLQSANDAAAVIADHISGDQSAFAGIMNRYARNMGCTSTNFTNAHGLHDPEQLTTARDMAKILDTAMKNEDFVKVWKTVTFTIPATNKTGRRYLNSNNYLQNKETVTVYFDDRVTGARTGVMETGERSIACTAEQDGMKMICIVMGSKSTMSNDGKRIKVYGAYPETKNLLNAGMDDYKKVQLLYPGRAVCQVPVNSGDCDLVLECRVNAGTVIPKSTDLSLLTYQYQHLTPSLKAPIEKGEHVSDLEIWFNGACVARAELFALNQVKTVEAVVEETNPVKGQSGVRTVVKWILLIILGVLVAVILVRGAGMVLRALKKRKVQKYRKYRGRSR